MNYWHFLFLFWQNHLIEAMHEQSEDPLERIRRNSGRSHKANQRKLKQ